MASEEQRKLWELGGQGATTTEGFVLSVDWAQRLAEVNVGGIVMFMPWVGAPPLDGQRVRVNSAGGLFYCMSVFGASIGTVASVGGGMATVTGVDGESYTYPYLGGAPSVGAVVRIDHAGRVVLGGAYSASPPGADVFVKASVPASAPPKPKGGKAWFNAIWSGNWRYGGFAGDAVEISTTRVGMYGYGRQIADTIPDDASIRRAELHLTENWDNVPGVASSMGTHGFNGRPGSGVSNDDLVGSYAVPGLVQDIRGVVADRLKTGAALGVGFRSGSSGYRQYGTAPGSGRIYMEWS